jgi:integrase
MFISTYSEVITNYIVFKRSLGYELSNPYHWKDIDQFLESTTDKTIDLGITENQFYSWYQLRPNESLRNKYERACRMRGLSGYLRTLGYDSYVPDYLRNPQKTFVPYIFSEEEINTIFSVSDTIASKNAGGSKELSSIIFRILYSTGIRVGELISLKLEDFVIDGEIPHLKISNTKNKQDRLDPVSESTLEALKAYLRARPIAKNDFLLINCKKRPITQQTVYGWFREILFASGIPHQGRGKGPRVHDLRHSFSVHSLHAMHTRGIDLYCSLPVLSKYLGHNCLSSTDMYVRLTAEMYPELLTNMSELSKLVFPEVSDEE